MYNCSLLKFNERKSLAKNEFGSLVPIESKGTIPFEIKRLYYIYNVDNNQIRGNHSHKKLHQVLICVHGSIDIRVENFYGEEVYKLSDPTVGLYIGPDNWRQMYNFSEDAVLLVIASEHYDEKDYIRDYDNFIKYSEEKYGGKYRGNTKKYGSKE